MAQGCSESFQDSIHADFQQLTLWEASNSGIEATRLEITVHIEGESDLRSHTLPAGERPRERLLALGAGALSTTELISLIIGPHGGGRSESSLNLAEAIVAQCSEINQDYLQPLQHVTAEELTAIAGIGEAKAAALLAAVELGKRLYQRRPPRGTLVQGPEIAMRALEADLMWATEERFAVLFLDIKNRILSSKVMSIGSMQEAMAHPVVIFGEAVRRRASRIIVAHNHPSGETEPSPQDIELTKQLLQCGKLLSMPVLDHLILAGGAYNSLRETSRLWFECPQE